MIGYWQVIPRDVPHRVRVCMGAHLGGCELIVERRNGVGLWRWSVVNQHGHELEGGFAPDAGTAERLAEAATFHIHPPCLGDWIGRLL